MRECGGVFLVSIGGWSGVGVEVGVQVGSSSLLADNLYYSGLLAVFYNE